MIQRTLTVAVCLGAILLGHAECRAKDKELEKQRNRYTAVYPVKFYCAAVGGDRDVILMETGDPRFAQIRPILGSIFKPYPKPDTWIEEDVILSGSGRLPYESDIVPRRRLESWYFVHGDFLNATYDFTAIEGESKIDTALAILREIMDDPTNKDMTRTTTAAAVDIAALMIAKGDLKAATEVLVATNKVYADMSGSEPWNWLHRAMTKYEYYTRKDERVDTALCVNAGGKATTVGPLTLSPAAYIQQPFLRHRWDVVETPQVSTRPGDNCIDMVPGINKDGSRHVLWVGVRCVPFIDYLHVSDSLPFGVYTYMTENDAGGTQVLALAIENTGQNSVPLGEVSWSLIIDGKAGPTHGMLYDVPDQQKATGIVDVAFRMKPGFTYQMYVNGPTLEDLKRIDSFVVRVFDMPQELGPDGSVTKRGYVDIPYKVTRVAQEVPTRLFVMQSPMVCRADYVSRPMVNVPTLTEPVFSARQRILPSTK